MTTMPPLRILVADDHPVVRDGLSAVLSTQPDFEVVGEAQSGAELVAQAAALRPQVILTDLEMPTPPGTVGIDGIDAIRQIRAAQPETHIIVLTAFDTDDRIVGAIRAGAEGYLLKGAPRSDIFHAIRVVGAGGTLLQPLVVSRLVQHLQAQDAPTDALTEREHEVLSLMAKGHLNKEIAEQLGITPRTVKFHVSAILSKLGAGNRTEAVRTALLRNLVTLE
jgi:DNA-binding NarL/FixJ family response regulator